MPVSVFAKNGKLYAIVNGEHEEVGLTREAHAQIKAGMKKEKDDKSSFVHYANPTVRSQSSRLRAMDGDDGVDIRKYCATRFANDSTMRRRFKCNTTAKEDPTYGAALERYIAVETKCRADEASPQQRKAGEIEKEPDDFIGKLSRSVFVDA